MTNCGHMDRLWAPWRMSYIKMDGEARKAAGCIFCDKAKEDKDTENLILHRGLYSFVLMNLYPYNNGHLMVAPYLHTADLIDLGDATSLELINLTKMAQAVVGRAYGP